MGFNFEDLSTDTRRLMLAEVSYDEQRGRLFVGTRLTVEGKLGYPLALKNAVRDGDDRTLAQAIIVGGFMKSHELSRSRYGKMYTKRVPADAAITLAEGEFNRFYIRALCVLASEAGIEQVQIYRAKLVHMPRWQSQALIGTLVSASALLHDLRENVGSEPGIGVPGGPNSGLSVRLLRAA